MRDRLITALRKDFCPRLADRGFEHRALSPEQEAEPSFRTAYPLGFYRRRREGRYDLLDIQFDKHSLPRFVINAGVIEAGGLDLPWGDHVDAEAASAGDVLERARLLDGRLFRRWYGWRVKRAGDDEAAKRVVARAARRFDQIERWLATGEAGPHMAVSRLA